MVKVRLTPLSSFSKRRLSEKRRMFFDEEACSGDTPFEKTAIEKFYNSCHAYRDSWHTDDGIMSATYQVC